ncbi:hypothetical protein C8R44DRAFT_751026 [Mycena epipterygia]|nr:hypothetical protein C8R44DRAFT_751026 [Mycena epipterygia]
MRKKSALDPDVSPIHFSGMTGTQGQAAGKQRKGSRSGGNNINAEKRHQKPEAFATIHLRAPSKKGKKTLITADSTGDIAANLWCVGLPMSGDVEEEKWLEPYLHVPRIQPCSGAIFTACSRASTRFDMEAGIRRIGQTEKLGELVGEIGFEADVDVWVGVLEDVFRLQDFAS